DYIGCCPVYALASALAGLLGFAQSSPLRSGGLTSHDFNAFGHSLSGGGRLSGVDWLGSNKKRQKLAGPVPSGSAVAVPTQRQGRHLFDRFSRQSLCRFREGFHVPQERRDLAPVGSRFDRVATVFEGVPVPPRSAWRHSAVHPAA